MNLENRTECFKREKISVLKIRGQFPFDKVKTRGAGPNKFL